MADELQEAVREYHEAYLALDQASSRLESARDERKAADAAYQEASTVLHRAESKLREVALRAGGDTITDGGVVVGFTLPRVEKT